MLHNNTAWRAARCMCMRAGSRRIHAVRDALIHKPRSCRALMCNEAQMRAHISTGQSGAARGPQLLHVMESGE